MTEAEKDIPTWRLLSRGQYPGILVNGIPYRIFYSNYYTTYVERDVRDLMRLKNIMKFDTFVRLLVARVGSEFNAGGTFKPEYMANMNYISEFLSDVAQRSVIYDGPTSAPLLLNIRDI